MRLLLLLLLTGLVSAQYLEPPIDEVVGSNTQLAPSLEGIYNSSYAFNGTVNLTFGSYTRTVAVSSSIDILALSPSIDNMSCVTEDLAVLFARGEQLGELIALPSEGYPDFACDPGYPTEYAWRCDFDIDTCVEFVNSSGVLYDSLNVTFTFRNKSVGVPFSSTLVAVPEELMDELDSASGNDSLLVSIDGNLTFFYEVNDRQSGFGGDCGSNYSMVTSSIPVSINRSFKVGGSRKLFFLRSPVTREQWYRDNRFDVIVLSQCPLYYAEVLTNGNLSENLTLRTFSIATSPRGIASILSNSTNTTEDGWSEGSSGVASPFQLEHEDVSFIFVYEFNHSYAGLGDNNLSLMIRDITSQESSFNETLTSRMLSFHGIYAEDGSPSDSVPSRPSLAPPVHSLVRIEIVLGLISLILIIAFVNSWLLGGS